VSSEPEVPDLTDVELRQLQTEVDTQFKRFGIPSDDELMAEIDRLNAD
jgi:hypothetical protein